MDGAVEGVEWMELEEEEESESIADSSVEVVFRSLRANEIELKDKLGENAAFIIARQLRTCREPGHRVYPRIVKMQRNRIPTTPVTHAEVNG